jgi:oligoribonuclease NrnB/cAMP/cGMP phosphodiesterase (DHH superfamily)
MKEEKEGNFETLPLAIVEFESDEDIENSEKDSTKDLPTKYICYYHGVDLDGKCSAAIVNYFLGSYRNVETIPIDYGYKINWDQIDENTEVIMVDVSLSRDDMIIMKNTAKKFIWIDHHITKIEELKSFDFNGLRREGTAACMLTWEYFIDLNCPESVQLLGDYDVWKLSTKVLAFQYGMRQYDCVPKDVDFWCEIFENLNTVKRITDEGYSIYKYTTTSNKKEILSGGFITNFRNYKMLAANKSHCSSLFFEDHPKKDEVDILMAFAWNGKSWKISMYTLKKDIDVSKICYEFGGGGHKQAAGFYAKELPTEFQKMIFGDEESSTGRKAPSLVSGITRNNLGI